MPDLRNPTVPDEVRDEVFSLSEHNSLSPSDVGTDKDVRAAFRDLARRSLYFLTKAVLQYTRLELAVHKPVCDFIQDLSIQRGLVLLPRGVFKTTIGTIGFIIWLLLNDPNRTILLANQTTQHAERMLTEIEQHLGGANVLMNYIAPEMIKPGDKHKPWNQEAMDVPSKTAIRSGPSVLTIGVGTRAESIHQDFQVNDDLVGIEDMFSDVNRDNALTWHDYERNLFVDPVAGIERMYGTRWPGNDFYKPIISGGEYQMYWKPAQEEDGTLNFPTIYPEKELRRLRNRNWLMFNANILNREIHPGSLEFKVDNLQYFKLLKDPEKGYFCHMGSDKPKDYLVSQGDVIIIGDTAASGDMESSNRSDIKKHDIKLSNNAIVVLMGHSEMFFVLDAWAGRAQGENPELQIANKLYEMCVQWRGYFRKVYIEAFGAHGSFITIFNMVCRQNNAYFPIEPLPKGTKIAKDVRIRTAVGSAAQNRQLCVRQSQDGLISEYTNFPSGTKDFLDCLTWGVETIRMPLTELGREVQRKTLHRRALNRMRFIGRAGY